ncbi:hypothetical protein [Spiroplasma endosymbiont of Tiphia femorata]|uniref:hypothetical protein n=1 Tax=Spiroplasma endosymbiont of Tiphia femorata TaxID=3066326 RepID=UPI0030CF399A
MKTKKNSEQTPLLNKNNNNYNAIKNQDQPSTSQEHVNGYHQENLEVRNKDNINYTRTESQDQFSTSDEEEWINDTNSCYGGITQKRLDINERWKYRTRFEPGVVYSGIMIHENVIDISNDLKWQKTIRLKNGRVILELSNLDENNQFEQKFKIYENENAYLSDLKSLDLSTFTEIKQKTPINWYFIIAALGIIPIVVFAWTTQRVFSVNITDNKPHPSNDWITNILDVTNEKTQHNLMMASADIIFSLLTGEIFKWSRKVISPCCQTISVANSPVNNSYFITSLIHLWSTFSNHVVVTAAAMYTLDSFTWPNYGWKLIDKFNILSTIARLYAMTTSYPLKGFIALVSFGAITFSSNALKTLASLVAENGFTDGCLIFPNKFFTLGMLGTATAMSITDGLNLQLDNYKKPLLQPILNGAKWIWTKTKSCCINNENDNGYGSINNDNVEDGVVINNPKNDIKDLLEQQAITEAKKQI